MAPKAAAVAGFPVPATVAVGMPKLFNITRLPSNAAAFAACTASFGCAFFALYLIFLIVWK
jgi:hypothetical protein